MRWRMMAVLPAAVLLLAACGDAAGAQQAPAPGVAEHRLARLRRGVNLGDWLGQQSDAAAYTQEHFDTTVTPADLALIRAMGFDHVRLAVDPRPLFHKEHSDRISPADLAQLDAAVKMILDDGMAADIVIYADAEFKGKLATDDAFVEEFADFWRALARHFAALDPGRVFFEILNEPETGDRYRWYGVEAKLATAIREGAPQHTIIASGARFSDNDSLLFLEPLRDANVIYAFHFYSPFVFTHQGATWAVNYWHYLRGVPYPSDPARARQAAQAVPDAANRLAVVRYGLENWNAARIAAEIGAVEEWARRWDVPVICNEFGVYRPNADPRERARWLGDVRAALDMYGIGWALWDYSGGFGVVSKEDGRAVPDESAVRALGLAMPGGAAAGAARQAR